MKAQEAVESLERGRILELAIQRAMDNGWEPPFPKFVVYVPRLNWIEFNDGLARHTSMEPYTLLFNHDFAKALWGEPTDTLTVQNNSLNVQQVVDMNGWRYHLQHMVVASDPIEYLKENA